MGERLLITDSHALGSEFFNGAIDDIILKLQVLKDGIIHSLDDVVIEHIGICQANDYGDYVYEVVRYETDTECKRRISTKRQMEMLAEERAAMMRKIADLDRQINEIGAAGGAQ